MRSFSPHILSLQRKVFEKLRAKKFRLICGGGEAAAQVEFERCPDGMKWLECVCWWRYEYTHTEADEEMHECVCVGSSKGGARAKIRKGLCGRAPRQIWYTADLDDTVHFLHYYYLISSWAETNLLIIDVYCCSGAARDEGWLTSAWDQQQQPPDSLIQQPEPQVPILLCAVQVLLSLTATWLTASPLLEK